ncbi:MAG TPA: tetratricopeptide repeat protein [Oculatellaceae cyanobacterium]
MARQQHVVATATQSNAPQSPPQPKPAHRSLHSAEEGEEDDNDNNKQAQQCRLPIVVSYRERDGVVVHPERGEDSDLHEDRLLVSINGHSVRGKALAEISKLCLGNEGEPGTVGVIDNHGDFQTYTFKCKSLRTMPIEIQKQSLTGLRSLLYRFDGTNGPDWDIATNSNDFSDASNLDLFTAASSRNNITIARDDPATSDALVDAVAIDATRWLITEGNLSEARRNLKIIDSLPVFDKDNPRQLDKNYAPLLNALDLVGENEDAAKLGYSVIAADERKKFFSVGASNYQDLEVRLSVCKAYLRNLARTKPGDVSAFIQNLQGQAKTPGFFGGESALWLGDFYESIGAYDKAISCYDTYVSEREHPGGRIYTKDDSPDQGLSEARYHCYLLFRLAQFASQQNSRQKAVDYLRRTSRVYSTFFTEEQLTSIESLSMFSPSPSAVELELARQYLKMADSESAIKYARAALERIQKSEATDRKVTATSTAPSGEYILKGLESGKWANVVPSVSPIQWQGDPTTEDRALMSTFLHAEAAIASGDIKSANEQIETLLQLYRKRVIVREYPRPFVNAHCCLLHLARHLADSGQHDQSTKLLDQIRNDATSLDQTAVTALFIDIEKALNAELSQHPEPKLWRAVFDKWYGGYTDYESLRALACLYLEAGEYNRAEVMLDKALKLCKDEHNPNASVAFSTALVYLDKAYLAASTSHFEHLQKHLAMALSTVDSLPISAASRNLDIFNRQFMCRTVQISRRARLNGKPECAEKILKDVTSRMDSKNCWLGVFETSDRPSIDTSQAYFYGYYGRLLCDHKKFSQARPYLDKAVAGCHNSVPAFLRVVRARCAAEQGDYAIAARDMEALVEFGGVFGFSVISVQPKSRQTYARLAVDYAGKAKGFDRDELGKLYKQLADLLNDEASKPEKLELLKKAYEVKTDSSRDKVQVAQDIANLIAMNRSLNTKQASQADLAAEFKMQESAAMLAEKNNQPNAAQLWMNLAGSEVNSKQYDLAIQHVNRAINLQTPNESYGIGGNSISGISDWPIRQLAEAGRPQDAEQLYLTMLSKIKGLCGPKSIRYADVLAELCIFYTAQNNREKSVEYLNELLALDPRRQELGQRSASPRQGFADQVCGLLYKHWQNPLPKEILEKLLDAQRSTYGSDDAHVARVLAKLGIVETNNGNYAQAEKYLREAIAIDALYGDDWFGTGSGAKGAIDSLLNLEHKTAERESLHAAWEKDRSETEKHWSMAENATKERAQEFYDWWHKKGPYGYRCLSAAIKLLDYAVKEKDWERVRELGPECIKILSHSSLLAVGGCTPSPQPAARKFTCFKSVIEACLASGHADEAHKWLDRAVSEESYEPLPEELIFLGEIEGACGNKQAGLAYCKRAEATLPKSDGYSYWRWPVHQLYHKLDSKEDLKRLDADARAQMLIRQEADLKKFEVERRQKLQHAAQLKQPPLVSSAAAISRSGSEVDDSIEPRETLMFPPMEAVKAKYLFNYAAYASEVLWLNNGAQVIRHQMRQPFSSYSFAGSYSAMASVQPQHKAGNFLFLYDGPAGSLVPKFELAGGRQRPGGPLGNFASAHHFYKVFTAPPPVMAIPLKPALETPATATVLTGKIDRLVLKAGDYVADNVSTNSIVLSTDGRVRIFIKDAKAHAASLFIERRKSIFETQYEDKSIKPVFEATAKSCINLASRKEALSPRSTLELWYNGRGEIRLGQDTSFTGIIYAPNATVRLGKRVTFWGAMVAETIIVGEDSQIMYQTNLENWSGDNERSKSNNSNKRRAL